MANKSKVKGDSEERAIVNMLRENGFICQRTLENGARSDGSPTWDIDLFITPNQDQLKGECKIRKYGFKEIYKWLGSNDFLTLRADKKPRVFVVPESFFIEAIKTMRG